MKLECKSDARIIRRMLNNIWSSTVSITGSLLYCWQREWIIKSAGTGSVHTAFFMNLVKATYDCCLRGGRGHVVGWLQTFRILTKDAVAANTTSQFVIPLPRFHRANCVHQVTFSCAQRLGTSLLADSGNRFVVEINSSGFWIFCQAKKSRYRSLFLYRDRGC